MHSTKQKGFTLIEMLVVTVIIIIITSIVVSSLPDFRSQKELELTAQQVLAGLKEMQVSGISGRSQEITENDIITMTSVPVMGINISKLANNYTLFRDIANNPDSQDGVYTGGLENIEPTKDLPSRVRITKICRKKIISGESCHSGTDTYLAQVNITFQSPHIEAMIRSGDQSDNPPDEEYVKITFTAQGGRQKILAVWSSGRMELQ